MRLGRYKREAAPAIALGALLLVAVGMTLVILAGEIDISVGSQFAICAVLAATLAKSGVPVPLLIPITALLDRAEATQDKILALALGHEPEEVGGHRPCISLVP